LFSRGPPPASKRVVKELGTFQIEKEDAGIVLSLSLFLSFRLCYISQFLYKQYTKMKLVIYLCA
jgi:hypothetical protein